MEDHGTAEPARRSLGAHANAALLRATGYRLQKPATPRTVLPIEQPPAPPDPAVLATRPAYPADRLLSDPVFVLSSVRSGSTLLRLILDSHPQICAPHELHLRRIFARTGGFAGMAMHEIGLGGNQLRYLLWDRLLHRELRRAGKTVFVNKTPTDALIWPELVACWPDARFIYLHRHPAAMVASWTNARPELTTEQIVDDVWAYTVGMEQARSARGGHVVRYEDLTADPHAAARGLCEFLGVEFDPVMLEYGRARHTGLRRGLGDWSTKMSSGSVQAADPVPSAAVPDKLRDVARAWGYLHTP